MEWLEVHDWADWQSYRKDRGQPPWIKVHRTLMRDVKWVSLGCQERGQLVAIWLLAADHNGKIPDDASLVRKLCYMDEDPNLSKFIDIGLLDEARRHNDASVAPERRQDDEPEVEVEVEVEVEKKTLLKPDPPGFDSFWDAYPRKKSKAQARKAWISAAKKTNGSRPLLEICLEAIAKQRDSPDWTKDGGKFIPYPATWLNAEAWADEVTERKPSLFETPLWE